MFYVPENYRITEKDRPGYSLASDISWGNNGQFLIPHKGKMLLTQASDQGGWEHVSVSLRTKRDVLIKRRPTWDEMSFIKSTFWDPEDLVLQYHLPDSKYINIHPYVLHLWRPVKHVIPFPPSDFF